MNTYTKLYPTCRHCHASIDLALEAYKKLRDEISLNEIEKVTVRTLFGVNPAKGVLRLKRLSWFISIPLAATLVCSRQRLTGLLKAFILGCSLLSLEIFILHPLKAYMMLRNGTNEGRDLVQLITADGSMTDGQMLLMSMLATLALIFVLRGERKRTIVWWIFLALQIAGMAANFKRGSWICACVFVSVFLVARIGWRGLLAVTAVVILMALLPPVQHRFRRLVDEIDVWGGGRMTMWVKIMPYLIKKHPWGIGYGSVTNEMWQEAADVVWARENPGKRKPRKHMVEIERTHLHSNMPQVLVETGWLGLFVYLTWMFWSVADWLRWFMRVRHGPPAHLILVTALGLMLLGLFANGAVEYNFGDAELVIVLAMLMGILGRGDTIPTET